MELDNIITLSKENGEAVKFEFLDLIEWEEEEYVVLLPVEDENDGEVVILKVEASEDNPDEEVFGSVDDEETLMKVFEIFKEKYKDEFNFED